jgi:hypothetical protein
LGATDGWRRVSERSPTRTAFWWLALGGTAILVLIGLADPSAAPAAAVITAIGLTLLLAADSAAALIRRIRAAPRSGFAPDLHHRPTQTLPPHVVRLVPSAESGNRNLTAGARTAVITVATEILWARHGLNLYTVEHHVAIEQLVTPDLWELIRPATADGGYAVRRRRSHAELDHLLDELEQI